MTDRWTPDQLARDIRWVVALEYAGGTWYLSDQAMTIDDGAGGTIVVSDGLLDIGGTEESIDLWSTDSPRRSVQVEFDLGLDVAELVERGHDLAGCVAEVAQLADGDAWSSRRPFVRGRLVEPQYGADGEGVRASVEQDVFAQDAEIRTVEVSWISLMQPIALATGLGYDNASAEAAGDDLSESLLCPTILGTPGNGTGAGSIAVRARYLRDVGTGDYYVVWVIAGHAVAATSVTLQATDGTTSSFSVETITTNDGPVVAYVLDNISAAATWTNTTETATVIWDSGGGLVDQNYGALRYAGDYLAWLLALTEESIDHARVNRAREALRAFTVSTYLDEAVSVSEYVREVVLDILPISLVVGPRGVYPYVWKWDATSEDAVAAWDLTVEHDISRDGLVTYEDGDRVVNTLQLLYGWRPRAETYVTEMWAVGDPASRPRGLRFGGGATSLSRSYWSDPVLARSVVRYGVRSDALESAIIHDDLTASHVLAWRARRWALPSRVVVYEAAQRWGWIEPGDLVTVTDPDLAWTSRLCLVQARSWAEDGAVRYTLRVQEG